MIMSDNFASESQVKGYHSHVYFSAATEDQARALCAAAEARFGIAMGRMHQRAVGPHPDWSCQLAYKADLLGQVLPWLAMNRGELVVFTHPITGDDLKDHRDFAIWMGEIRPLNLAIFSGS